MGCVYSLTYVLTKTKNNLPPSIDIFLLFSYNKIKCVEFPPLHLLFGASVKPDIPKKKEKRKKESSQWDFYKLNFPQEKPSK